MKVCLLNVEFEVNAGTERLVATHANAFIKAGHEVDVACAYYKEDVFPDDFKNVNIIEYSKSLEGLSFMHRTRVSLSLLRKKIDFLKDYDAVIAYRPFTNVLAARAKRSFNFKNLWYCSHPEKHLYPQYFKTLNSKNFVFRLSLLPGLLADQRSVGDFDQIYLNSYHMWTKFNLIYDYNNHSVLYPPAGKLYKRSKKGGAILSVSRIEPAKNQLVLLKALRLVKPLVKTYFVGKVTDPDYFALLKSYVKRHGLNVVFKGELSDVEIQSLYDDCFLSVYTPFDEDFGIVPLESLSSGQPCLTHVSNGVSEVLPERFVYSSVKELARRIMSVREGRVKSLTKRERLLPKRVKESHLSELLVQLKN